MRKENDLVVCKIHETVRPTISNKSLQKNGTIQFRWNYNPQEIENVIDAGTDHDKFAFAV